jgi:hypothetical protein
MATRLGAISAGFFVAAAIVTSALRVQAQALRLRADAVAETQSPAPAGLVVIQGEDKVRPWFGVEGLVWAGGRPDADADILTLNMKLREPHGLGELRAGRFVLATGAVRPVQLDGISALARASTGTTVEAFTGTPVVPRLGDKAYDVVVGGRVAQSVVSRATVGVSYVERRSRGEIVDDEIGADLSAVPVRWLDLAARSAYDLTSPGVADALASAAVRSGAVRFEAFGTHRSPGRLLPATSLFSVLGDFPSQTLGGSVRWEAAPRLDLLATGAGQLVGGELGGNAWLRAVLRLDDRGQGSLGAEGRRQDVSTARWTGLRLIGACPIASSFRFTSELEFVFPDEPRGRGFVWPWGLLAFAWRGATGWEAAIATEAASTPEHRYEMNALARLSRTLEFR